MEASKAPPSVAISTPQFEPNTEALKQRLLKKGACPTPRIVHDLRKEQIQKHNRKLNKLSEQQQQYRSLAKAVRPWERRERGRLYEVSGGSCEFVGEKLRREPLRELKEIFEGNLRWVLEDDVDVDVDDCDWSRRGDWDPVRRRRSEAREIRLLVDRLSERDVTVKDWKLAKIMKQSGLWFTEGQLLKIVGGLGNKGKGEQALAVVEWVYNAKERRDCKSRFVYTKLLSILGKERKPKEALCIFNLMREDCNLYPDMAAYHAIAVLLGQAGLLKDLLKIIECMGQKPKRISKMRRRNWDPVLEPDLVIYNAVLNACITSQQWKGVSWVFEQLRKSGLKPNEATYGLAMEVMLHSGKYALVHEFFDKMNRSGLAPKALTYKVLVKAFRGEGKVHEAVEAVRDMEQRGVVGTAAVYYELACFLCYNGRWKDAMLEVEMMKKVGHSKPLEVAFTGMILSSMDGGHVDDCISIFEHMKAHCVPNIGTVNTMLKIFGQRDMFHEAKELFEEIKRANGNINPLVPDVYTYSSMLKAAAAALQWEYFEYVYKEMALAGHQLDQNKHALLLVEASRAGKVHLLEHAFDAVLEAGEIPHPLFFTEMVLQATAKQNYERAVALVNTMAYAPFQVSERQWTEGFKKSGHNVCQDSLEELLDALGNSNVASEVTVSNLTKSLQSLCAPGLSRDLSSTTASGFGGADPSILVDTSDLDTEIVEIADNKRLDTSSSRASTVDESSGVDKDHHFINRDVSYDRFTVNLRTADEEGDGDLETKTHAENGYIQGDSPNEIMNLDINMESFADDGSSCEFADCLDANFRVEVHADDVDEVASEKLSTTADDSDEYKLPSANEILGAWKESRNGDGIFFPFQLDQKME